MIDELFRKLKKPRRIMMLVKAGEAVDAMIEQIVPHLESGDIVIDGGNSEYHDSNVGAFLFYYNPKVRFENAPHPPIR